MSNVTELVPVEQAGTLEPARRSPVQLKADADAIRELQRAVLQEGVDFGVIPGTPKPSLYKSGAEWLLKWAGYGFRSTEVGMERGDDGKPFGATYRCTVHLLSDPMSIVSTCDGYAGRDETKWAKAPWNTILKMAQKRALVGAALNATGASGIFTQDVEDNPKDWYEGNGWASKAEHDAYRAEWVAAAKAMSPERLEAFKLWMKAEDISSGAHSKRQAEKVAAWLAQDPFGVVDTDSPADQTTTPEDEPEEF